MQTPALQQDELMKVSRAEIFFETFQILTVWFGWTICWTSVRKSQFML